MTPCVNQSPVRAPARQLRRDAAQSWLERTNPLHGLSIGAALSIWDCARGGDTQRLHWLFQEIESANPVLMTCVERRAAALAGFLPSVTVQPAADQTLGDEQKDAVERFIAGIANFSDALEHLALAFFRGFAFAQPVWEADGTVREIALPESWEFLSHEGRLYHNPACGGFNPRACVDCAAARLVSVRRRRAIDYPALSIHIRAAVGERDWGRFLERYALPKPAVIMPPTATNENKGDFLAGAAAVENGQVSVWPSATMITDFAGGSRGTDPFSSFISHQEKLVVLMATGGTLTSLAESGSGTLAGGAQMDVWREIVERDAGVVAAAVARDLVRPFLAAAFPGRAAAVDFALAAKDERSPKEAAELAAVLRTAGYTVEQSELEKAVGFTLCVAPESPALNSPADDADLPGMGLKGLPSPQKTSASSAKSAGDNDQTPHTPSNRVANPLQNSPRGSDGQGEGVEAPSVSRPLLAGVGGNGRKSLDDILYETMARGLDADLADDEEEEEAENKSPADDADDADDLELTQEEADEIYEEMMGL